MAKQWTLKQVKAEVKKLDPQLSENDTSFTTAVILISGLVIGANADKVARFTGYRRSEVRDRATRLRENGVWQRGKTCCEWFEKETGGIAFWMDVMVADGLMAKSFTASEAR